MIDPYAPERNLHHTVAYRTEADWEEDMFGKGPYDPDQPFNKRDFYGSHRYNTVGNKHVEEATDTE